MASRIAVIAAHPDDEILGCGGTVARRSRAGDEVVTLIVAEGATSRDVARDPTARQRNVDALREAAGKANAALGVKALEFGGLPDNRLDSRDLLDVVKVIEVFIAKHRPQIVLTHFPGDLNIDHQIVSRAVSTACRPLPAARVSLMLFFEVPSSTEWQTNLAGGAFSPNWFEDISSTLPLKLEALRHYDAEMRPWPHPRSYQGVESLARWRGATIGRQAAEAFSLGRKLVPGDGYE